MHETCHEHKIRQKIAKLNKPLMQKMSPLETQLVYALDIRKSQKNKIELTQQKKWRDETSNTFQFTVVAN